MSDVFAIFGILIFMGVSYPGLLVGWKLFTPGTIQKARLRLERSPWRCFWLGLVVAAVGGLPAAVLLASPFGPAKLLGWTMLLALLSLSSMGAAGLAERLSAQFGPESKPQPGQDMEGSSRSWRAFLKSAVAIELASAFPLIGWFTVFPLATLLSLGAAVFALLRRMPARARPVPEGQAQAGDQAADLHRLAA